MVIWRFASAALIVGIACTQGTGPLSTTVTEVPAGTDPGVVTLSVDCVSAMFDLDDLKPGDQHTRAITVTYMGSATPAGVVLYVSPGNVTGSGLERYLHLTVESGSISAEGAEQAFSGSAVFSGTLEAFYMAHASYVDGTGLWMVDVPGERQTFRFTITLLDDNRAQGLNATVAFTWEAQVLERPSR